MVVKAPGSLVERAAERLRDHAAVQPRRLRENRRIDPPEPGPRGVAQTIRLDTRRLSASGIFSPATHANRTTEEIRLVKQAMIQRQSEASGAGLPNAALAMVTSTREGEGKSFISANLALSLAAEEGRSVILIDADPHRSAVASIFGVSSKKGLIDAIADERLQLSDVLIGTDVEGLYIIPAGHQHALSAELFSSERTSRFFQRLMAQYPDAILILDAPPVLATSEASALARQVGQILYVVEAERIGRSEIAEALDLISMCPKIGFVLNKIRFQFGSVRFGNYYRYYRRARRGSGRSVSLGHG